MDAARLAGEKNKIKNTPQEKERSEQLFFIVFGGIVNYLYVILSVSYYCRISDINRKLFILLYKNNCKN
jgi:hypothetical protein